MSESREQVAASEATEEITCLLARAHLPAGAYWQQINDILARALAACALSEARWWAQHQSDLAEIERIALLERAAEEAK